MKYVIKTLIYLILVMIPFVANATSYRGSGEGEYYLGVDLQYLFLKPRVIYQDFFKKQHPGADLYAGYRLNKFVGFEIGYGWTTRISKKKSFTDNQMVLGGLLQLNNATTLTSKIRYRNTHFDVNGYFPLGEHVDGILSFGVGFLRPHVTIKLDPTENNLNPHVVNMKCKTTPIARAGLGLEGLIGDYWGIRGMIRYENTSNARVRGAGIGGNKILKNGIAIAFGFYRYFD